MNKRLPVIIESPYAGDDVKHMAYLGDCIKHSISLGEAPFASHGLYPRWLNDNIEHEREIGIECGYAWMSSASKVIFYSDLGMSRGMMKALVHCRENNFPHDYRFLLGKWANA